MAVIGTTDATGGGWVTASGNNNGGVARGISHDHVQDAGSRVFSSGMPLNNDPDGIATAIGSKVVANDGTGAATTDRHGVAKAVSGGTLAFTPATTGVSADDRKKEFVMMGVSSHIGGVANTQLTSSRTHNDGLIKQGVSEQLIASQSGTFSNPNNSFDSMATPSTDITPNFTHATASYNTFAHTATFVNPADGSAAVASEIHPSRSVPGELTYHFGHASGPITDEYKAKDAFEAADDTSS
tara:strand:+ start:4592 stop:5314 length:723 start_codon:yes stop_codon:yes gene_type:complete